MDNKNELFPVVDMDGNTIGSILRSEAHNGSKILHPVVHLHVFNSEGELFLQHRPAWKDIQPDKCDTACGGHIDYGETVDKALQREVKEELGMTDYEPKFIKRYVFESQREKEMVNVFYTVYDGEVSPSEGGIGRRTILDDKRNKRQSWERHIHTQLRKRIQHNTKTIL